MRSLIYNGKNQRIFTSLITSFKINNNKRRIPETMPVSFREHT
jgi:hypothetical protein